MQKIISIIDGVARMPDWRMSQPVNFTLCDGENIAVMGPNGGGKSMFVDIITGKHPLLGDAIKYDFAPSKREYISDNIKYVCFKIPTAATTTLHTICSNVGTKPK